NKRLPEMTIRAAAGTPEFAIPVPKQVFMRLWQAPVIWKVLGLSLSMSASDRLSAERACRDNFSLSALPALVYVLRPRGRPEVCLRRVGAARAGPATASDGACPDGGRSRGSSFSSRTPLC